MKLPTLLLAGSLLANAALVTLFAFKPVLAPPAIRGFFDSHASSSGGGSDSTSSSAATKSGPTKALTAQAEAEARAWESLHPDDLSGLAGRLRAAGFPASVIRAVVSSMINERFAGRYREILGADDGTPAWKIGSSLFGSNDQKRQEQYTQLNREQSKLYRELLGKDFMDDTGEATAAQRRQFGDISRAKIDLIQRINEDYNEMSSQLRAGMQGITLPEDRDKLALLEREKRADLAAMLSPEELADYEMRTSPITRTMASRLANFDASEAEFRAIYQIQKSISDQFGDTGGAQGIDAQLRTSLQQQFVAQMKAALGPERYADYDRSMNRDYQSLTSLAEREKLPATTALQAFNLRDTVAAESNRIFDDTSLNAEQKRAALASLAQNTRTQLLATLGPTAGPAYLQVADNWLRNVEAGSAVSFTTTNMGTMTSTSNGTTVTTFSGSSNPTFRRVPAPRPPGATPALQQPPVTTGTILLR